MTTNSKILKKANFLLGIFVKTVENMQAGTVPTSWPKTRKIHRSVRALGVQIAHCRMELVPAPVSGACFLVLCGQCGE